MIVTQWKCEPQAESLLLKFLDHYKRISPSLQELEDELFEVTSSRLFDWIDHIVVRRTPEIEHEILEAGLVERPELSRTGRQFYRHPAAQLPPVVVLNGGPATEPIGVAVKVEYIHDFLCVRGMEGNIEGSPYSSYRRCEAWEEGGVTTWVVERRDSWTLDPTNTSPVKVVQYLEALELWKSRPRDLLDEDYCLEQAQIIAEQMISLVGRDMAAWAVHEAERCYWQARNTAGQVQKIRQDRVGMGWANHDHHTYRSSRRNFFALINLMKTLGFHCRERFYAGDEAGWGAQVMENPNANLVLFLDVDLQPHEVQIDFSAVPMSDLPHLGTIGLWCALHGDSLLKAGLHHLEAQFEFDKLREDLDEWGIGMMAPFSNFSYLRQQFSQPENWQVASHRIETLLAAGKISPEQAKRFLSEGAIGSHLENLQRREGYKGFNQKNVSHIIQQTDPRAVK